MTKWTIEDARKWAGEAFVAAMTKYPNDVEGALIFYSTIVLGPGEPTQADIDLVTETMMKLEPGRYS